LHAWHDSALENSFLKEEIVKNESLHAIVVGMRKCFACVVNPACD